MAPVAEGYVDMIHLETGAMTLWDIALANDVIAVRAENRRRAESK